MGKVLISVVHRKDRSPSQRFRFEQYLNFLASEGYEFTFSYLLSEKDDKYFYRKGYFFLKSFIILKAFFKRTAELFSIRKYDIIFVQRESFMLGTSVFEKLYKRLSGAKLVYDFDDSIWMSNVSEANKKYSWLKKPDKTKKLIRLSDLVIVGNDYLKDYALQFNKQVVVIPTTIDTQEYQKTGVDKQKEKIVIGWSGSITTIQHFAYALNFLKKIKEKYKDLVDIVVIGDGTYVNEELGIKGLPWNKERELEDLSRFDIGIMPLPDDEWAQGKCGLKGLQYMSLEIPTIMSPVGVNKKIIQHGVNGYLASTDEQWIEAISELIENPELRKRIGAEGRKSVLNFYSVESQKLTYLSVLNRLVKAVNN